MHFLPIVTLVLLSRCSCVREHTSLKLPQLPLVSKQGLQEAEDCSLLAQGFANYQERDGFVILISVCKGPLLRNRPQYILMHLCILSYFTSLCFTTCLGHGHWMSECKVSDSCMHSACEKKGTKPKQDSGKGFSKSIQNG